ncbi:unnamed protein product, partial [Thlaspi arvense]
YKYESCLRTLHRQTNGCSVFFYNQLKMESDSRPSKILLLSLLRAGHMVPLFEVARLFAVRGEHVTFITTPANATMLQETVDKDVAAGRHVALHIIPFPSKEVGLPEGIENLVHGKDLDTAAKLHMGTYLLQQQIEQFLDECPPDCIISDVHHPWTTDAAARLRIPRLVFHGTSAFARCLEEAVRRPDSPHLMAKSDYEPFVIPSLPDPITMMRSQLPGFILKPDRYTQLVEQWVDAELRSYGTVVNNFYELGPAYTDLYKKLMGHNVFNLGPVGLIQQNSGEKAQRAHKAVIGEEECLAFLNSKTPSSVLYICFGSACIFPDNQLMEIACGLEASGHNFMWVVFGKDDEKEGEKEKWLPKGEGMIIKGWAPQLLILDHPSVGGFLTHCGWNSVIEGVTAGLPMITWPLYAEHFFNEKLVTQVMGIGVGVGKKNWSQWVWDFPENEVVGRLTIEDAVRRVMDAGDPAAKMVREKARALGKKAREAVEEGGSSYQNLTVLIQELKDREKRG